MNKKIHFEDVLSLPPSINRAYTVNEKTLQITYTRKAKQYILETSQLLFSKMKKKKLKIPINRYFYIDMKFWLRQKNSDSHNYLKIFNNMLEQSSLTSNDCFIMNRIQEIRVDSKNPRIEIKIIY